MTTVAVTRMAGDTPYVATVPIVQATDEEFDAFFVQHLREFLYRRGCRVEHIPDETLLIQTRNTFQTTRARDGITVASPVKSG